MGSFTYVPLALWLVLSNILAFLMLMVVAPKAEDFVEQSLHQKRIEHESSSTVAVDENPKDSAVKKYPDSLSQGNKPIKGSIASLSMQPVAHDEAIINNLLEPFVGTMRPLQSVLLLAFIAGYLGGSLHALASLLHYRACDGLTHHWTLWYIARPLKGAITAVIFSFIIQAGLMTGVSGDSVVNPIGIIALSLLVGMSAHDATNRLGIVFATFFNTSRRDYHTIVKTGEIRDSEGNMIFIYSDGTHTVYSKLEEKPQSRTVIDEPEDGL